MLDKVLFNLVSTQVNKTETWEELSEEEKTQWFEISQNVRAFCNSMSRLEVIHEFSEQKKKSLTQA